MKKLFAILAVATLASCGTSSQPETTTAPADSTFAADSAFGQWADSVTAATATVDTTATNTTK